VPNEHASLPVATPSLDHLTADELNALRGKFSSSAKDARRKANQAIQRNPSLKKPWTRSLNVNKGTSSEERTAILAEFERELLRIPEAFIAHAYANSLVLLEAACRDEMQRRSMPQPAKRQPQVQVSEPSPEGPLEAIFRQIE